jgi:methylmalonyl-CoA decarboxylase
MPLLESKIEGFVGTICLDYFEKRNAFSAALVEDFVKALEAFAEGRIRAVVLRAKPAVRIWSAGHDADELPEGRRDRSDGTILCVGSSGRSRTIQPQSSP